MDRPWGCKESDMTERLTHTHTIHLNGELCLFPHLSVVKFLFTPCSFFLLNWASFRSFYYQYKECLHCFFIAAIILSCPHILNWPICDSSLGNFHPLSASHRNPTPTPWGRRYGSPCELSITILHGSIRWVFHLKINIASLGNYVLQHNNSDHWKQALSPALPCEDYRSKPFSPYL